MLARVITRRSLAPSNLSKLAMFPDLAVQSTGFLLGNRNSWKPYLIAGLRHLAIILLAPYRWASHDIASKRSARLMRKLYLSYES